MNASSVTKIFAIFIVIIAALFIIIDIVLSRTSSIGSAYLYMALLSILLSTLHPAKAMYMAAFLTCCVDLFKRLMILGGLPTEIELAYIQALPMILVTGASLAVFLPFFKGKSIGKQSISALIISFFVMLLLIAAGGSTGGTMRKMGQALNMGAYSLMLFSVPLIFKSIDEQKKYLRFCFMCFIFVAIYMLKHYYFGLAKFEYDYMITGLSQEVRIFTVDGDARRYFSSLNSGATVSTMLSVMCLYAFVSNGLYEKKYGFLSQSLLFLTGFLFLFAAVLTLSRTGLICGIASLFAYFLLGSKLRIGIGYALAATIFFALIFSADTIIKYNLLDEWQTYLNDIFLKNSNSADTERALVIGTMYDRLSGWRYLAQQPMGFPLFGSAFGGVHSVVLVDRYSLYHDLIVQYLVLLGWIPMLSIGVCFVVFLVKLHRFQFSLNKNSSEFNLLRYCIASFLGILVGGMANGAQLFNFPQNFYFWLWLAICLATYQRKTKNYC